MDQPKPEPAWRSQSHFVVGVDLGQSQDPTAVCVIESYSVREDPIAPAQHFFDVRHLMRFPLGLSYPTMVGDIGLMLSREPLGCRAELVIDETGVGKAVADLFDAAGLKPFKVTITAGNEETQTGSRRWSVPKGQLVSLLDARMHTGELRFARDLREAAAMEGELKDFRRFVSEAGRYSFSARSGQHDDLVLACAIALWRATKLKKTFGGPRQTPQVNLGYAHRKSMYRQGR